MFVYLISVRYDTFLQVHYLKKNKRCVYICMHIKTNSKKPVVCDTNKEKRALNENINTR